MQTARSRRELPEPLRDPRQLTAPTTARTSNPIGILTPNRSYFMMQSRFDAVAVPMNLSLIKHPSAFLPLAMSIAALAVLLAHIAIFGAVGEPDEGTAAHLWQLLMAGQVPVVVYFAAKWLPRSPAQAFRVLTLQAVAILAACAPVYFFKL
jgi:hypothetical protein